MNILVISLLRVGDVLISVPTLTGLKRKYPDARIQLLINRQSKGLGPLLSFVDQIHELDRDGLQASLVSRDRSFFEPYDRLTGLSELLNRQQFDLVLNLTHTRLSGWLMAMINGKRKLGLEMQTDGRPHFGHPWFQFLNDEGSGTAERSFHYSDIFAFGAGLSSVERRMELTESVRGQEEAQAALAGVSHLVAIQPFTSDLKKTWPLQKWKRAIELIHDVEPDYTFGVLCAPPEREQANLLVRYLQSKMIDAKVMECSLEGAYSILKRSQLLVTGDTSIKHLGAAAGVRILELSLGSSSFERTGAYSNRVTILQAKQECAPCSHSRACPFESPECHDKISPEAVALTAQTILQNRPHDLRLIAQEFNDSVYFLKGDFSWEGEWRAVPIAHTLQPQIALEWIDRSSQKLYLSGGEQEVLALGSEGVQLRRMFNEAFPSAELAERMEVYKFAEAELKSLKSQIELLLSELRIAIRDLNSENEENRLVERMGQIIATFRSHPGVGSYVRRLSELHDEVRGQQSGFHQIRRAREVLAAQLKRIEIEQRLITTLRNQELEVI